MHFHPDCTRVMCSEVKLSDLHLQHSLTRQVMTQHPRQAMLLLMLLTMWEQVFVQCYEIVLCSCTGWQGGENAHEAGGLEPVAPVCAGCVLWGCNGPAAGIPYASTGHVAIGQAMAAIVHCQIKQNG